MAIVYNSPQPLQTGWTPTEKNLFRFFFLYFVLQVLPLDGSWWHNVAGIHWLHLQYTDIFLLTRYQPALTGGYSYLNWLITGAAALVGAVIWAQRDKQAAGYPQWYYWLRVLVRYRLAIAIIGYGFIKIFPLQSPYPSISNLNTHYGDFTRWKLFSLSLGIVPNYESFLGIVEVLAGLLLLFRKTATFGAAIILFFTGNVYMSNLAYDGGEQVYSLYLISLALFLLAYDARRLFNLLYLQRPTAAARFTLPLQGRLRTTRIVLKTLVLFVFVLLYGFKTYSGYRANGYQFPTTPGLANAAGIYNVSSFRLNNDSLPYSDTSTLRWQDVVFEKWATLSIRTNKTLQLVTTNEEQVHAADADKDYELAGSGGREYFSYTADTVKHELLLQNKNKQYASEKWQLHYSRQGNTLLLWGANQHNDSVHVVLNRIPKKYLLKEAAGAGRQAAISL